MARSFMTLAFAAIGLAGITLLAVGHKQPLAGIAPSTGGDVADAPIARDLAAVRYGRDLVTRTDTLIGPATADPSRRYAGNSLVCTNCHLDAGTKTFGLPYLGVYDAFPAYRPRSGKIDTIADRINECMTRSLNGRPLPLDGPEMAAFTAYVKSLSAERPAGVASPGRGPGPIAELTRAADPARGHAVYGDACAACHGADGRGRRNGAAGDTAGYAVPPLWGEDSFNDGAGMARLIEAAAFIRNNMPRGIDWRRPALPVEDAWDVAAFILSQPRPHKDLLDRDYPIRAEKPVDTAYGPYADGFSLAQHKLGPFRPIREALAGLASANNASSAKPRDPAGD